MLVAAHAPPERGFDGIRIRLLELAIGVIRATPHLGQLTPQSTAEVTFHMATLDEMASLWQALATPLQPSVLCLLRVVTNSANHDEGGPGLPKSERRPR